MLHCTVAAWGSPLSRLWCGFSHFLKQNTSLHQNQNNMNQTQKTWTLTTDGEANFHGIATPDDWLMRIQINGSIQVGDQLEIMQLIQAAPELLKALKLSLFLIEEGTHPALRKTIIHAIKKTEV